MSAPQLWLRSDGGPLSPTAVSKAFDVQVRAFVRSPQGREVDSQRLTFHGMRHSFVVAQLADAAVPRPRASERRAHAAGVPARWVTADEVYGRHFRFRTICEELGLSYVLAVPVDQWVIARPGPRDGQEFRADALIAALPVQAWRTYSAG